ncbi:MAG TPA: hypothetical protein VNM16_07305 [Bacillota bacterium]|nr:hypothetical protein [Bacillota bacterium]
MSDFLTVLWKEAAEFVGNRRSLRVFAIAVLFMGILPDIQGTKANSATLVLIRVIYVALAAVIVVAQTAPNLVIHEREGHTLETLLATRLPDRAIFAGKVAAAVAYGYGAAMLTMAIQLIVDGVIRGSWSWSYLAAPIGRWFVFGVPVVLAAYLATVGTFVALRIGDQRSAYLVTMLSLAVIALPFVLGLVTLQASVAWVEQALFTLAVVDALLAAIGVRLFNRERLILYQQE